MRFPAWLLFCLIPILLACLPVSAAEDPAGTWIGQWERDGSVVDVEVTFERTASGYEGSFSSDQLRVVRIPFRKILYEEPRLSWELAGDRTTMVFDGTLQKDTLAGRFRDGDAPGTFRLTRSASEAGRLEEKEVSFSNGSVTLRGTVVLPAGPGPFPGVVFLHGSGAEGRWASRYLAYAFARHGIAALIYDKRGVGASTGDWRQASFEDLVGDASAAVETLRSQPRIAADRVGIHGHSQGGTLAPWVAHADPRIAFVVASAGTGLSMADTETYSLSSSVGLSRLTGADKQLAERYIRAVVSAAYEGAPRTAVETAWQEVRDRAWAFKPPAETDSYWTFSRRIASYDPPAHWRQVQAPALLLYGEADERVPPRASASRIAEAYLGAKGSRLDVIFFPGADHTFRPRPASSDKFQWPRTVEGYPDRMIEWVRQIVESSQAYQ